MIHEVGITLQRCLDGFDLSVKINVLSSTFIFFKNMYL